MAEEFRDVSKQLRRAQAQRITPLDAGDFTTMDRIGSIDGPGVEPLLDTGFLGQIIREQGTKIDELIERTNLLTAHNILLEDKQAQIVAVLNTHTSEIADSLRRIIDVEPETPK